MIKWIYKQFILFITKLFTHIPTEKELYERRIETAKKLGFYFYCKKERQNFIKELLDYDFCKDLPKDRD